MTTQVELLNKAFELLEKMLLPAKLASSGIDGRGNGFRITEYYTKNYKGREATAPDALATIFYEAVRKDVQDEINGGTKGSLVWLVPPKALQAHYVRIGREVVHHKSETAVKTKRVSTESAGERADNLTRMEVYYDALGVVSPRSSALRGFINEMCENPAYNTAEALKVVKTFYSEGDWRIAVNKLQQHLVEERA